MTTQLRKTGLEVLGDMPWGTHCCHFFQTQTDLLETMVPYFQVGLEGKEFCLWVIHPPMTAQVATRALKRCVPDGDRYLAERSIEIVSSRAWYLKGGTFSLQRVLRRWDDKLTEATTRGYVGMRVNGNVSWLQRTNWKRFEEYERALDESLRQKAMIVLCSYALDKCRGVEILDVARTHQFAIAKRAGHWQVVEWRPPPSPSDSYANLTIREREVLFLAAEGLSNPEIAKHLSISVRTVESHRANFMRKLGLRNQTDLVRYALRRGLLAAGRPMS